jgi:hypothetical protein
MDKSGYTSLVGLLKMENLKLSELKQEAKKRGIVGYSKLRKQQLIDILSLPEIESIYEKSREHSIDERPDIKTQKNIAKLGGVSDKKSAVQEYLDSIVAVSVPDAIIDKMSRSKLQNLEKQSGTKTEMFRILLRKEISGLFMVLF